MYKRYYDGYARVKAETDSGEIIVPQNNSATYNSSETKDKIANTHSDEIAITNCNQQSRNGLFSLPLEIDDLILIGVLLFLLTDTDNDDPIMLIIIAFIFLSEII